MKRKIKPHTGRSVWDKLWYAICAAILIASVILLWQDNHAATAAAQTRNAEIFVMQNAELETRQIDNGYVGAGLDPTVKNGTVKTVPYAKNAGVVTPTPETTPEPEPDPDPKISLTSEELEMIAKIVYLEARGESVRGQQLVAEIILSRVLSDRFPDTVEGVLSAPGQFATWATINTAYPTEIQYAAVQAAMETPESEYNIIYFGRRAQNSRIYAKVGNHVFCYI